MTGYVLRRMAFLVLILVGVTIMTFALSHIVPGDPARLAAGPGAEREQVDALRGSLGLDESLPRQYLNYVDDLRQLDFGTSIVTRQPVSEELRSRIPATLELVMVSFLVYLALAISLAVVVSTTRRRGVDTVVRMASTAAYAIPAFVLALWLQYMLFFRLGWLPSGGRLDISIPAPPKVTGFYLIDSLLAGDLTAFADAAEHLLLPVLALTFGNLAIAVRLMRATLLTEQTKDYVKMARLKGLTGGQAIRRHVLRNSLVPTLALFGIQFGYLIGGTVVIETIFSWPGLGAYAFDSIIALDYAPVMGVAIVTTIVFVLVNFLIDMLYPVVDPRIRLWGEAR